MVMVKNYIYIATKIENKFLNFELVQEMRWGRGGKKDIYYFHPSIMYGNKNNIYKITALLKQYQLCPCPVLSQITLQMQRICISTKRRQSFEMSNHNFKIIGLTNEFAFSAPCSFSTIFKPNSNVVPGP